MYINWREIYNKEERFIRTPFTMARPLPCFTQLVKFMTVFHLCWLHMRRWWSKNIDTEPNGEISTRDGGTHLRITISILCLIDPFIHFSATWCHNTTELKPFVVDLTAIERSVAWVNVCNNMVFLHEVPRISHNSHYQFDVSQQILVRFKIGPSSLWFIGLFEVVVLSSRSVLDHDTYI